MATAARRAVLAAASLSMPAILARAQGGWPDRPIRLIYPFATGAGDFLAGLRPALQPETLAVPQRKGYTRPATARASAICPNARRLREKQDSKVVRR